MKKLSAILLVTVFLLVSVAGCGQKAAESKPAGSTPAASSAAASKPAASGAQVVIKYGTVGPAEHQYTIAATEFKKIIEKKSNGRISVQIFPNAQLGGERELAEGVKMGTIQMTTVTTDGTLPAWVPETQIFSIPYLFQTNEQVYKALDGKLTEYFGPKFEAQGFKHLSFAELGFRHFTNNKKPINTPDDMKNMKIRVQEAPIWFALMKAIGANATPIAFNELYTALQQGTVDGQENPLATIRSMKFYEVQKYLALDGHTYAPGSTLMNLAFFKKLSAEDQKLVQDSANEMKDAQRKIISDAAATDLQFLKDHGMQVTEPDKAKFAEATKGVPDDEKVKTLVPKDLVDLVRSIK